MHLRDCSWSFLTLHIVYTVNTLPPMRSERSIICVFLFLYFPLRDLFYRATTGVSKSDIRATVPTSYFIFFLFVSPDLEPDFDLFLFRSRASERYPPWRLKPYVLAAPGASIHNSTPSCLFFRNLDSLIAFSQELLRRGDLVYGPAGSRHRRQARDGQDRCSGETTILLLAIRWESLDLVLRGCQRSKKKKQIDI